MVYYLNLYDFKIENSKLKLNYGYGLGIEDDLINLGKTLNVVVDPLNCISYKKIDYKLDGKDISSYGLYIKNGQGLKINNDKKLELDLDPYKGLQFYNNNQLGLKANISEFIGLEPNSGLKVSAETQKLSIDINPLKARLYDILGDNLIYNPTTKKLNAKENHFIYFFRLKSLIEDHSITYLNLQDKSGMKFDRSNNNVTEMMNYRNKIFEYKSDKYDSSYDTKYIVDNKNPNESHLKITSGYFESSIIEDYRVTVFVVIKSNTDNIFELYDNSDHSLTLLYINSIHLIVTKNISIEYTTTDIHSSIQYFPHLPINKKILICLSWNGVNSAAYING